MKTLRVKKKWVKDYNTGKNLVDDLQVLYEFLKKANRRLKKLSFNIQRPPNFWRTWNLRICSRVKVTA